MKSLHILTHSEDEFALSVIGHQRDLAETEVEIVDLTVAEPDYKQALEAIFEADSVAVW